MKPDDNALERLIRRRFTASVMSDAKWVRVISWIVTNAAWLKACQVKLVWDEAVRDLLYDEHSSFQFDFYDHAMEAMISGKPLGFYSYREIEWLEFPARIRSMPQDLIRIQADLAQVGRFDLERTHTGLRLFAYR